MKQKQIQFTMLYNFKDAPEELRWLSKRGGDEDYIVVVPDSVRSPFDTLKNGDYVPLFGWCQVEKVKQYRVYIFSHA